MAAEEHMPDLKMEAADLYLEEVFTDRRVGSIRRLTPVTAQGDPDEGRAVRYVGQAQLMTPVGTLPLSFEIEAGSLKEAVARFGETAQDAVEQAMEELKEMRREAAGSIIVPEGGGGGMGGGGAPGGGIQLR